MYANHFSQPQLQNTLLQVVNISKTYQQYAALNNINFTVNKNENLAIIGSSGSGKSTLLKIMSGNLQATNGNVYFDNKKVLGPNEQLLSGHKQIAYLSQQYELLNNYVVKDLLWFDNKLTTTQATKIFEICNITHLLQRRTNEVSGGEKQRIALCKLLIKQPQLLLLDEPFSNLDFEHKSILKKVIAAVQQQLNITIVLASHDPQDVLSWANNIIVLQQGCVVQQNTPFNIYYQPTSNYVAGLMGVYNILPKKFAQQFYAINNDIIFRPQQIIICNIDEAQFSARIISIEFYGNYYLCQIIANDELYFTMQQTHNTVVVNETIGIKLNI